MNQIRGQRRGQARGAFTLVELLVVIAIIVVLVSLGAWGVFATIGNRQARNSEQAIRVLNKFLQRKVTDIRDEARKESPSPGVMALANGDLARAKVIWIKARLVEAFPVRYAEVLPPPWSNSQNYAVGNAVAGPVDGATYFCIQANVNMPPPDPVNWVNLIPANRHKSYFANYKAALAGKAGGGPGESSACLLLALKILMQTEGVSLEDQLGYAIADSDKDGVKELVDGFGQPLLFYRFAWNNADLQKANPAVAGAANSKFADPFDTDGKLVHGNWYNTPNKAMFEGLAIAPGVQMFHAVGPAAGQAYYVTPTIVSAGRDGKLGLGPDMSIANATDAEDNIYSFQLRGD